MYPIISSLLPRSLLPLIFSSIIPSWVSAFTLGCRVLEPSFTLGPSIDIWDDFLNGSFDSMLSKGSLQACISSKFTVQTHQFFSTQPFFKDLFWNLFWKYKFIWIVDWHYNIVLVFLIYINRNRHRYTCVPHPNPLSFLPIPSLCQPLGVQPQAFQHHQLTGYFL